MLFCPGGWDTWCLWRMDSGWQSSRWSCSCLQKSPAHCSHSDIHCIISWNCNSCRVTGGCGTASLCGRKWQCFPWATTAGEQKYTVYLLLSKSWDILFFCAIDQRLLEELLLKTCQWAKVLHCAALTLLGLCTIISHFYEQQFLFSYSNITAWIHF